MHDATKSLTKKLSAARLRYFNERSPLLAAASEAVSASMLQVKTKLGLAGLKAAFYDNVDTGAKLTMKLTSESGWEPWDSGLPDGIDDSAGMLQELSLTLTDLAEELEWDGEEIAV